MYGLNEMSMKEINRRSRHLFGDYETKPYITLQMYG